MEMRSHWLTYSHHIILLRAVGTSQCYRAIWSVTNSSRGSSILLHITFSIIYGSSQAGSCAKGSQETVLFNYLNTLINKEPWGLSLQILLSKVLYKAFTSNTRVMELSLSFWNVVHFLPAEHVVYTFPYTNPMLQVHLSIYQPPFAWSFFQLPISSNVFVFLPMMMASKAWAIVEALWERKSNSHLNLCT